MPKDKFSATWVSHSSIADFLACPRAYYLKNVWKRPETKHKVQIVTPSLSLGSAVHEVVEALSVIPTDKRFVEPLLPKFEAVWKRYQGRAGGFFDPETEAKYKTRGINMINRITTHPGPLKNLAVKINMDLPSFWLSEEENIILCGKVDWLEYDQATDSVRIIDFKTSKSEEKDDSLQLPIYVLLATNCQNKKVSGAAYWYLDSNEEITPKELPNIEETLETVRRHARSIKVARALDKLTCKSNGCRACTPLEKIFKNEAEFVGVNSFGQDCFVVQENSLKEGSGIIL